MEAKVILCCGIVALASGCGEGPGAGADQSQRPEEVIRESTFDAPAAGGADALERQLLQMHAELIRAHLENRVDLWMPMESGDYTSVNGGRITFPSLAEREVGRAAYLAETSFDTYRDLREPIVRVSEDGSLGWLMAEVEISGTAPGEDGEPESFDDVWAWVEFYEMTDDGWRMVGNASNRR